MEVYFKYRGVKTRPLVSISALRQKMWYKCVFQRIKAPQILYQKVVRLKVQNCGIPRFSRVLLNVQIFEILPSFSQYGHTSTCAYRYPGCGLTTVIKFEASKWELFDFNFWLQSHKVLIFYFNFGLQYIL